ncbi:unnamed protein product [Owenia fusiformis]|uniref:Uncharacterized protein n=1 Tax=Owenia fusiformis TaxID=6347 RepID=A0A8J1T7W3_OWEFU|nr:unnamed protein product [Owenia fusiformis]
MKAVFIAALVSCLQYAVNVNAQQYRIEARWCCINPQELEKCEAMKKAFEDKSAMTTVMPPWRAPSMAILTCVRGAHRFDCMMKINNNEADLLTLDAGMGYIAGEYYTMMPIMAEKYESNNPATGGVKVYSVGVMRKNNRAVTKNEDLKGKASCHTGTGHGAGWVYPISHLLEQNIMEVTQCNVPVKSAADFFRSMCAPNALQIYFNPFGANPASVCNLCVGQGEDYCSTNDPFAGYQGAFECVSSGAGDIAFLRENTIEQMTKNSSGNVNPSDFDLLCPNNLGQTGSRMGWENYKTCNWGMVPGNIVMTSAFRSATTRDEYKKLMEELSAVFGATGPYKNLFDMFQSAPWGGYNLLFSDDVLELIDVGEKDNYDKWVGDEYREKLEVLAKCDIRTARWCVISTHEMRKCESMIQAFSAKNLKPVLDCILGISTDDCMQKISQGDADLMTLDAGDIYKGGKDYNLVPIAAEDYSGYSTAKYYSVAVARKRDSHLTIFNLKGRRACTAGAGTASGWLVPVDTLVETNQIRILNCDTAYAVGEFFSKACIPGVLDTAYNTKDRNPINLCEVCASGGQDKCRRNSDELYFGGSGAFRCLTEDGGDVAFIKHFSVRENTDGRNQAEWARNRRSDDYELMCKDGKRKAIDDWADCNLGEVPSNAVVTAHFKTTKEKKIYWNLLNYAQQFFASDSNPDFAMFDSYKDYKDLIFQDATVRLIEIEPEMQEYKNYLGSVFTRGMERLQWYNCQSAASVTVTSHMFTLVTLIVTMAMFL